MGWASGSAIAQLVWDTVRKHIPKTKRRAVSCSSLTSIKETAGETGSAHSTTSSSP